METQSIAFNDITVPLKNLEKVYFPESGVSKADVLEYYLFAAPYILPHIKDKPFTMIHFPHGLGGDGKMFYQKQRPDNAPDWLHSVRLDSEKRGHIDWCLVNDEASLSYMVNRGVLEMHTWFSRLPDLDRADIAVIDLDPSGATGYPQARILAQAFHSLLDELKIKAFPKTSGGRGIHIAIPIALTPFNKIQEFLLSLCRIIAEAYPETATMERFIDKRGNRVYLDAVQNQAGKTIAAPYSLRVKRGAPVSAPLFWEELEDEFFTPADINITNIKSRIERYGDLTEGFYSIKQILPRI